jgi:hypothetical protein
LNAVTPGDLDDVIFGDLAAQSFVQEVTRAGIEERLELLCVCRTGEDDNSRDWNQDMSAHDTLGEG